MTNCHNMKKGDIYSCEGCGLELQVVKECTDVGKPADDCSCSPCTIVCCDKELQLKK